MKKLFYLIALFFGMALTSCYKDEIKKMQGRLDVIEGTHITSITGQLSAIKNSLSGLEKVDKDLDGYIETLQEVASGLQESINTNKVKIEDVKVSLQDEVSAAKIEVLDRLNSLNVDMQSELTDINLLIASLQASDAGLERKIADLKSYVDSELADNKDWANATFATLEQYGELAVEISTFKSSVSTLNTKMESLESRMSETILKEISDALDPIKEELVAGVIAEIADSYMSAISDAMDEITVAYTDAISSNISNLEESMKSWVSDQLKGYYTVSEVEGKLIALESVVADGDMSVMTEINVLRESLEELKTETANSYRQAIKDAINENNGVVDGKIAVSIAEVNVSIANEVNAIKAKISAIETRLSKIEADIATIGEQIRNINNSIVTLEETHTELLDYISDLENTASDLQSSINQTNTQLIEVESTLRNETAEVKNEVLNKLRELKSELDTEISVINSAIALLQTKDADLEVKIKELRLYVNTELAENKDWAQATFATLLQYAELSGDVATIKAQIASVNQDISSLETRINNKITTDVSNAVTALDASIQEKVKAVSVAYTAAISDAKDQITAAYTAEIRTAFNALDSSMKQWVSEQLQEYYTISEVEGLLATLRNEVINRDNALLTQIVTLEDDLSKSKQELINICSDLIDKAVNENNGIIDAAIQDAVASAFATVSADINAMTAQISNISSRLEKVEGDIAGITIQIANIDGSITALQSAHDELTLYLENLQGTSETLQQSVNTIDAKIETLRESLQGESSTANAQLLAQLASLRAEVNEELNQINQTIAVLEAKDVALDQKVADLQIYVDAELSDNRSWADATFATLEQQNELSGEISTIRSYITSLNQSITDLESRINAKVAIDLSAAVETLNSTIQNKVDEISTAYTSAISKAQSEITAAYTTEIQRAFNSLESKVMSWVNEQLSGYYTISEVESMLTAMRTEFDGKLAAQKAYLEGLLSELSNELQGAISANTALISSLRSDLEEAQNSASAENAIQIANNATAIANNAQKIIQNSDAISANTVDIDAVKSLVSSNKTSVEANTVLIAQNQSAIDALRTTTNASIIKNAADIAANAENIAKNAALIAQNATAIQNNVQAIADNAADIQQLQQELLGMKNELVEAYEEAIATAVNTLGGQLSGEIATVNNRITTEIAAVNTAVAALTTRVDSVESEVNTIKQQMSVILSELADLKQNIAGLMSRIQSITYIPKYSDGKATVIDGVIELDFQVSPKDAVNDIVANWQSVLSINAIYTITRAVSFIDMPILSCEADQSNSVISLSVLADGLSDDFYGGTQSASAALSVSDGNNKITSDYIQIVPYHPYNEIWYTSTDGSVVIPKSIDVFGANIVSNNYVGSKGVIRFDAPVTSVGASAFQDCYTLATIELPDGVTTIGTAAFNACRSLVSISIPASVNSIASLGSLSSFEAMYIQNLSAWCRIDFAATIFSSGDKLYVKDEAVTELVIPSDVTELKKYAFAGLTDLTTVIMHDNVESIAESAFSNCSSLSEVTIGKGIKKIYGNAFLYCSNLSTIYCKATIPPSLYYYYSAYGLATYSFPKNTGMKIYVPESSYSTYTRYTSSKNGEASPQNWYDFKSYIVSYDYGFEPEPLPVSEGNRIFYTTTDNKPITLYRPESVNSVILSNTYEDGVGVITCGEDITEIGYYAFRSCSNLKTITLPSTVTRYGQYAITNCTNLTEIYITSMTPPEIYYQYADIGSFPFSSSVTIYVPSEAYDVYTQYTGRGEQSYLQINWSQHKSQLKPFDDE